MAQRNTQRNTQRARSGDLGSVTAARQQAEKAAELKAREAELSTISIAKQVTAQEGVFDPATGMLIEGPEGMDIDSFNELLEAEVEQPPPNPYEVQEVVQVKPATVVAQREVVQATQIVEPPMRTIRVNEDIENMTFGYGNNYTLEAGKKYRLPAGVCDHLEEKGLVWH